MILPEHVLQRRIFTEKSYKKVTNGTLTALENMGLLNTQEETIDVGAAAGIMSTFFAKKTKHVHAYEPSPSFVQTEKLKEKFDNVTTYNLAVSNFKGKETFYIDDKRLSQNGFLNPGWGKPMDVDVVTLDEQGHSNIGMIKIDTEGTELDVIKGADKIIKDSYPTLMVEIWDQNTPDPGIYFEHLHNLGYQMYWYWTVKKKIMHCASVDECVRDVCNREYPSDADFMFVHESRSTNDYTTRLISPVTI
tara:strand:+ start:121 stop:864 length:744 start_codon:yes stop_codon:yes gene_type:complete